MIDERTWSKVTATPMLESNIQSLPLISRGKVRDIYSVNDDVLLMVTTDRISAFDVVLDDPIPGKGMVLNQMSLFWFAQLSSILPNHLTGIDPISVVQPDERDQVIGRAVVVKRLRPIAVEAVVRGYLVGSGWQDYQNTGKICGISLPEGLSLASPFETPIFTPAYKAELGEHDENISYSQMCEQIGVGLAEQIRKSSLALYNTAAKFAKTKGIIIADTKFEFGLDQAGNLHLMDEVLTADSSRFWPLDQYVIGKNPPSFDKQFVRDWLSNQTWDKSPPAPRLPAEVVKQTTLKYREALERLCS